MILREWRAEIRRDLRDEYVAYVYLTGIDTYRKTAGNLFALAATRDIDDARSEIVTLSGWESMEAVRAFAGDDPSRARYFPEDDRYLLTRPQEVKHYAVHHSDGGPPSLV